MIGSAKPMETRGVYIRKVRYFDTTRPDSTIELVLTLSEWQRVVTLTAIQRVAKWTFPKIAQWCVCILLPLAVAQCKDLPRDLCGILLPSPAHQYGNGAQEESLGPCVWRTHSYRKSGANMLCFTLASYPRMTDNCWRYGAARAGIYDRFGSCLLIGRKCNGLYFAIWSFNNRILLC